MELPGTVVVVTGGASGIGAALCRRFALESPRQVVIADRDLAGAEQVAEQIGGAAMPVDVTSPDDNQRLVERVEAAFGPIDLFCANAGVGFAGDPFTSDTEWERMWRVNTMSIVYAARALLPGFLARGSGYLLVTASAAGLLTLVGSAPYSATKHAAVAIAEWLAITYGDAGVKVSCLCPQGVLTPMLETIDVEDRLLLPTAISPEAVAEAVMVGVLAETFLILPHPEVARYFQGKATDYDRWLGGMRKIRRSLVGPGARVVE